MLNRGDPCQKKIFIRKFFLSKFYFSKSTFDIFIRFSILLLILNFPWFPHQNSLKSQKSLTTDPPLTDRMSHYWAIFTRNYKSYDYFKIRLKKFSLVKILDFDMVVTFWFFDDFSLYLLIWFLSNSSFNTYKLDSIEYQVWAINRISKTSKLAKIP